MTYPCWRSATHVPYFYTGADFKMNTIVQFVLKHGYSILFAAAFAHQIGLPLPGPLFLLAAGALAAAGKLNLVASISSGCHCLCPG